MSRTMPVDSTEGFRVVVECFRDGELVETLALGSVPTIAGAKSIQNHEIRKWHMRNSGWSETAYVATGRIQRTATDWRDME